MPARRSVFGVAATLCLLSGCSLAQRACAEKPGQTPLVPRSSSSGSPLSLPDVPFQSTTTCKHDGKGTDHPVGPGQKYEKIGDVPWERLGPGDTVRIHHRPEPYREKFMLSGVGRKDAPIRVCGVAGNNGELPIIDGENATTRTTIDFPYDGHQPRGLIIVGKQHGAPWLQQPEHFVIEGLELRNADAGKTFVDKKGEKTPWAENAAGIFVQRASHVTIRGCIIHHNANGLFVGGGGAEELTKNVTIEGNYIYANASTENWYQHNVYNEASGVTYQYNRFGPPRAGAQGTLGGNIKERSAGVVIRYNWIEDGAHLIDLVDSQEAREPNVKDPTFHESWVYGNVLVRGPVASGSMVHYGGDSGILETYRKGKLHFFNNTVVILNASHPAYAGTSIFELSTNEEQLLATNNVFFTEAKSVMKREVTLLGARDGVVSGIAELTQNWLSEGITPQQSLKAEQKAEVKGFDKSLVGSDPGFTDIAKLDLSPKGSSPLKGAGSQPAEAHPIDKQYLLHGRGEARSEASALSLGAFAPR